MQQFTLEHNKSKSQSKIRYFPCPICGKTTFIWHKYDSYIHFKCSNKKCNHSIKLPISVAHLIKQDFKLSGSNPFKYFRFSPNIILASLSLYFDSPSSLRQIQRAIIRFYSIYVSHVSIYNWIRHFSHIFKDISNFFLSKANLYSDEWHIDETCIKINSITHYLWIVLDSETRLIISFHLSRRRDSNNALKVIDNLIESFNKTFKAWYKTKKGFKNFDAALSSITHFIFHYNFIRAHSSLNNITPDEVAGIKYSNRKTCNWLLF